jgi:hypothetical protein
MNLSAVGTPHARPRHGRRHTRGPSAVAPPSFSRPVAAVRDGYIGRTTLNPLPPYRSRKMTDRFLDRRAGGLATALGGLGFLAWVASVGIGDVTTNAFVTVFFVVLPGLATLFGLYAAADLPLSGGATFVGGTIVGVYGLFLIFAVVPILGVVSLLGLLLVALAVVSLVAVVRNFLSGFGVLDRLEVDEE